MRLATYYVKNMFERPKAMNLDNWADGKAVLDDFFQLNVLIQELEYSPIIKTRLLEIMSRHKGLITQGKSKYIRLRELFFHAAERWMT